MGTEWWCSWVSYCEATERNFGEVPWGGGEGGFWVGWEERRAPIERGGLVAGRGSRFRQVGVDGVGMVVKPVGESAVDEIRRHEVRFWVCNES